MPTIKPFRDYDEHDVLNLFKFSGTVPVNKGTFVKIITGWSTANSDPDMLGGVGASYPNTVSTRWGVTPAVGQASSGDNIIGMLLYDVKEVDENGEKLIYNPRKAAEMEVALSGQAVPVVTRGVFLYSGVAGTPAGGANAYCDANGSLTAVGTVGVTPAVGKFLGTKDANSVVLFKLDL